MNDRPKKATKTLDFFIDFYKLLDIKKNLVLFECSQKSDVGKMYKRK